MGKKNNNGQMQMRGESASGVLNRLEREFDDDDHHPSVAAAPWKLQKSHKTKQPRILENSHGNAHHNIISAMITVGVGRAAPKMHAPGASGLLNQFKKERPSIVSSPWKYEKCYTSKHIKENISQNDIPTTTVDTEKMAEKKEQPSSIGSVNRLENQSYEVIHSSAVSEGQHKTAGTLTLSAGQTARSKCYILNEKAPAFNKATAATGDTMKNPRHSRELPLPGEPGGLDDPLRRGLSGAGIRWYLRYLSSGLSAEKARAKAEAHKKVTLNPTQEPDKKTITPRNDLKWQSKAKPINYTTEPNTAPQTTSYAHVLRSVRVAVLAVEYPRVALGKDELKAVEESIANEITSGWNCKLQFNGIHFLRDMLVIDCRSASVAKWLEQVVPNLKTWKGVPLRACREDELPMTYTIRILLPQKTRADPNAVLASLGAQNEGLNVETWKVLNLEEAESSQALTVIIEEKSAQAILKNNCKIFYRFGEVEVIELKKNEQNGQQIEIIKEFLQSSLSSDLA